MEEDKLITETIKLEEKTKQLINAYIQAKEKIYFLEKENVRLLSKIKNIEEELENFQNQQKNTKLAQDTEEKNESLKELKAQINVYLKLLDSCIDNLDS